jgi:glycosyltransferase involved in cell wall biosynthesis
MLDLARELNDIGIDVSFYSFVTKKRARSFGLPPKCHIALLPYVFPLVALQRLFPKLLPDVVERLMCWVLDIIVILRMRKCDIFICMSGVFVLAAQYAQWRYNSRVHLHRSSRHVLSQRQILARLPKADQVSSFMVRRELKGYALADSIIVPSTHVFESFRLCQAEYVNKIFLNPLGVNIDQFPAREFPPPSEPKTVLFVGQWSYRKGADLLTEAIKEMMEITLIHVGPLADAPFPTDPRFVHCGYVRQELLRNYYRTAHVFVLPSREDGFGVVISQALASGVLVVCTERTGGPDIARLPGLARLIRVVPPDDPDALRLGLTEMLSEAADVAAITESERELLSWKRYAMRDVEYMKEMIRFGEFGGRSVPLGVI